MINYILRTCDKNGKSYNGFQWNLTVGAVNTAPDWEANNYCGGGLHGFLNGEGDSNLANWRESAIWVVAEVLGELIDLKGKVKFQSCKVLFTGSRFEATNFLISKIGGGFSVIGCTQTGGDGCTLTGGYRSTLTGGDSSNLTGGDSSTLTGGDGCTLTGGDGCTLTGGYGCTLTGGDGSVFIIKFTLANKLHLKTGRVGTELKPNRPYKLDENDNWVEV